MSALALVADGAQVAAGGGDNVIRLWTLPTEAGGAFQAGPQLTGHAQAVTALAVSPSDKSQLISASADGTVRQWNLGNNQQIREIKHGAAVTALAVRPDGQQIASAGADNMIKLWNAADGQPWTAPDKKPIAAMKGDFRSQFQVAQLERSKAAAAAKVADDQKAATDAEAKIISTAAALTAATTAKDAAAKTKGEKAAAVKAPTDAKAAADKELADATAAAKAATEKSAQAKAAADKEAGNADLAKAASETKTAADQADKKVKELEKKVADAAAALAKATQESTTAEAASMAADQAATAAVAAIKKAVTDVPLAEQALAAAQAALAKVEAEHKAAAEAAAATEKPIRALAYSPDGALLASAGDNNLVRTWVSNTGAPVETFAGHKAAVVAAGFAPDASLMSAGADGSLIVWQQTPPWTLERTIGSADDPTTLVDRVIALDFSPDGKWLATGGGEPSRSGELKIWNVADGSLVRSIPDAHSDTIFGLKFSPDGQFLASSGADRFVKVFRASNGEHVQVVRGPHASRAGRGLEVGRQGAGQLRRRQRDQTVGLHDRRPDSHHGPLRQGDHLRAVRGGHAAIAGLVGRQDRAGVEFRRRQGAAVVRRQRRLHVLDRRQRRRPDRRRRRSGQRAVRVADRHRPAAQVIRRAEARRSQARGRQDGRQLMPLPVQ